MAMGQHHSAEISSARADPGEVGMNDVYPDRHFRKRHSAIDHDQIASVLECKAIHPHFAEAPERQQMEGRHDQLSYANWAVGCHRFQRAWNVPEQRKRATSEPAGSEPCRGSGMEGACAPSPSNKRGHGWRVW